MHKTKSTLLIYLPKLWVLIKGQKRHILVQVGAPSKKLLLRLFKESFTIFNYLILQIRHCGDQLWASKLACSIVHGTTIASLSKNKVPSHQGPNQHKVSISFNIVYYLIWPFIKKDSYFMLASYVVAPALYSGISYESYLWCIFFPQVL